MHPFHRQRSVDALATVYDAVDVSAIPADAKIVLAYIDGNYVTYPACQARFPKAQILTVTTTGTNPRPDL